MATDDPQGYEFYERLGSVQSKADAAERDLRRHETEARDLNAAERLTSLETGQTEQRSQIAENKKLLGQLIIAAFGGGVIGHFLAGITPSFGG